MVYCQFCGWESPDNDARCCPKCREYKGLVRDRYIDDYDLDRKIEEFKAANPDWEGREP